MSTLFHTALGLAALGAGGLVVARRKGTAAHKWLGRSYAGAMLALCVSSFWIPSRGGPSVGAFGIFHAIAVMGIVHLGLGVAPVLWRGSVRGWYERHLYFTLWSFVGLIMATLSHVYAPIFVALAGLGLPAGAAHAATGALVWAAPGVLGHHLIARQQRRYTSAPVAEAGAA